MSVKILIVEDNPDHILITRRALQSASGDWQIDAVDDPKEGLKKGDRGRLRSCHM